MSLKIISYNIAHGMHLERVIEFLKSEQADILCLQEMATTGKNLMPANINIFSTIQTALGMPGIFEEAFACQTQEGTWNCGQATFATSTSEHSIINFETGDSVVQDIEKSRYNLNRNSLLTTHEVDGCKFNIANTHFTLTPLASVTDHQKVAARALHQHLNSLSDLFLIGDMNTVAGNETYDIFSQGFTDVTDPKLPTLHPTIHRVGYKGHHVDYIMYRGSRLKHLKTSIPVIDASDHLPVIAEFEILDKSLDSGSSPE